MDLLSFFQPKKIELEELVDIIYEIFTESKVLKIKKKHVISFENLKKDLLDHWRSKNYTNPKINDLESIRKQVINLYKNNSSKSHFDVSIFDRMFWEL